MNRLDFIKTLLFGAVAAKALPKPNPEILGAGEEVIRNPGPYGVVNQQEIVDRFFATSDVKILWPINGNFGKITSFELTEAKLK